jgi:hypothetical protein
MSDPARWFIGSATTTYRPESGCDDRPELAGEVERAAGLFARLGYQRVSGFGADLDAPTFRARLRGFLTDPRRRESDVVVVYYTWSRRSSATTTLAQMASSRTHPAPAAAGSTNTPGA